MPYIYLSKVNLNSKIYKVYDRSLSLGDVLSEMFINIGDAKVHEENVMKKYEDINGKIKKSIVVEKYCFNSLEKDFDNSIIRGQVIRTYPHWMEEYDDVTKEIKKKVIDESSSIYFYFDLSKEYIGFCTRSKFGYNQFNKAFKNLLEKHMDNYGLEVFLQKDKSKFEKKLERFTRVNKIVATLIPPNANEDDIEKLKANSNEIKSYEDANITKAKVEYSVSKYSECGLNMQSKMLKNAISQITLGYGDMNVHGINKKGEEDVVRANQDAALVSFISDDDNANKQTFDLAASELILSAKMG